MQALVGMLFNKDSCFGYKNVTDNLNLVIVRIQVIFAVLSVII